MTHYYLINPLSSLVFRSGKPFGAQSDTDDIIFPLPSAAAGLVRTVFARQQADFSGSFNSETLKQISGKGVFLVQFDDENLSGSLKIFAPKPADALYLKNKDKEEPNNIELIRLRPQKREADCGCDLPSEHLLPVQMAKNIKGKPQSGKPFWHLDDWLKWQAGEDLDYKTVDENGVKLPETEVRTHVAIDRETLASEDGKLFQTAAYDCANKAKSHHKGWEQQQFGFLIVAEQALQSDLVRFGGEGRLSRLEPIQLAADVFRQPEISPNTKGLKMTLLTPAIFENGWLPAWLDKETLQGTLPRTHIQVQLKAAAIDRWQAVSGWDLAATNSKNQVGKPKPTRKAVSAGAVYWFEIMGNAHADELAQLKNFESVSDNLQDQKDGFGIAVFSAWNLIEQKD